MKFAQEAATKVVFMADGRVIEEGTPRDIFVAPREERTKKFLESVLPIEYNEPGILI